MRQSLLVFVPVVGLMIGSAALPAAAPTHARAETRERQCFFHRDITNYRSGDHGSLYLRVRGSGVYQLTVTGACNDLIDSNQLAVLPEPGASRLCTDEWATLAVPGSSAPLQTCRAYIEKKLTDAEVAALPGRYRP